MGRARYGVLVAIGLLGACGDEQPPWPDLDLTAVVSWPDRPASPAELGYTIRVGITQVAQPPPTSRCRLWPFGSVLTVNGQDVPRQQRADGCTFASVQLGPFLDASSDAQSVSVRVVENGEAVAVAQFDELMPGAAATLASPADGRVRAGDEIVILPPLRLPSSNSATPVFYPLEGPSWDPDGLLVSGETPRLFDGIHAIVPAFVGRAVVIINVFPNNYRPVISCSGFAHCDTQSFRLKLGPVFVEGVP